MARSSSPPRFNNYEDDTVFQNAHFTQDISEQMRVPKSIKATGEYFDERDILPGSANLNSWNYSEKIDMTVPDRIVVIGQEKHHGTRSAPREILLENSIMSRGEHGQVRVSTPPRTISLAEHYFPTASEPDESPRHEVEDEYGAEMHGDGNRATARQAKYSSHPSELVISHSRESTPPMSQSLMEGMTPSEEVVQLRRQINKLNRRVYSIEMQNIQREQREKIVYCLGLAYFIIKAFLWLNRN
ncbi:transport and Golgi organization protein 11 isoform X2 [Phlebotomus argentipes]|uniref:transport and Golgi organization protein 11 isoform X2 n=1 Tax=Phlebotomus argentipes TaxID=94469 RepID=UPI002892CE8A|nr:transport and Golgi organization protein 11 isoform X2 [Phlebotomus argentipes]